MAGISQGLFFLFALSKIKNRIPLASKLLSAIFIVIILSIAGRFAYDLKVHQLVPHLFLFVDFSLFLFGPLYYFYTKAVLDQKFEFGKGERMHFIPAVIHLLSLLVQFSIDGKIFYELVDQRNQFLYNTWYFFEGLSILSINYYLIMSMRCVIKFNRTYSEPKDLFKVRYFLVMTTLMLISMTIWMTSFGNLLVNGQRLTWAFDLTWLPMVLITFIVGYYMIVKPDLFRAEKVKVIGMTDSKTKSKLNELGKEMLNLMKREKPYLDPDLSVITLASMMNIKPHLATKVLSKGLDTNFFELINSLRVDEFIRLAATDEKQKTYLALAYEVGFNSKTTFNKAFKKEKGLSPREYFKLHKTA